MKPLYQVIVKYDSYTSDTLAICTTLNKAKRLCAEKESELGDMPLEWGQTANTVEAWGTYTYVIMAIETNKRLL